MDVETAIIEETPVAAMPGDSATTAFVEESAVTALDVEERWPRLPAAPGRTLVGGVVLMTTWRNLMIIPPHRQRGGCAYPTATPSPRHFPPPIRTILSLSLAVAQ